MGTDDAPSERTASNTDARSARTGPDGDTLADRARRPVVTDCAKYAAALAAIAAIALGVFVLLVDVVDQDTLGLSAEGISEALLEGEMETDDLTVADELAGALLAVIGVVGIVGSAFAGALFGWLLRDDDAATIGAAASAFVGVLVLWVLGGLLGAIFTELSEEVGDLLVNGVLAGIGAAIAAGGGVRVTRSLLPPAIDPRRRTDHPDAGRDER